jgi:ATP-dependent DNA helicase DinG
VIIPKLPFSVPDQPLLEARLASIRANGGNPFMDYQLPEAVLKFRQGFGRLIRSQHDYGMVVILDPRIHTKPYGQIFLDSLPGCELIEDRYDL